MTASKRSAAIAACLALAAILAPSACKAPSPSCVDLLYEAQSCGGDPGSLSTFFDVCGARSDEYRSCMEGRMCAEWLGGECSCAYGLNDGLPCAHWSGGSPPIFNDAEADFADPDSGPDGVPSDASLDSSEGG